jgi:hypothetical protein
MPAFDLALGLGVIGDAANVLHISIHELLGEVAGDVTRPVVGQ